MLHDMGPAEPSWERKQEMGREGEGQEGRGTAG